MPKQMTKEPMKLLYRIHKQRHLPFISLMARAKSFGSRKLTKPYPLVLLVFLSRTTLAFVNVGNLENTRVNVSSVTSLPRSPQNIRKSSEKKMEKK